MLKELSAVAATLFAVSVALASPASAAPLDGVYSGHITGGGPIGTTATWVFASCGPDCVWETSSNRGRFILQGNTWTANEDGCAVTIDASSFAGIITCPPDPTVTFQLTKLG